MNLAPIHPELASTQWGVVQLAGRGGSLDSKAALEALCRKYWAPLYSHARRAGVGVEEAKDLTQSFFSHFLERGYIQAADPERGRFRSFLLTAFRHYCLNEAARSKALKRGGNTDFLQWDNLGTSVEAPEPSSSSLTPDECYDREWALTVMQRGLVSLKAEFKADGRAEEFALLVSFLSVPPRDGEYQVVASHLGIRQTNVAVRIHRMRQRYTELVREEVIETVNNPEDVDGELRYLVGLILHR